ncbi:GDSL-type esterase/lipase family protein [Uliginosibacterium sp. H3]|uniref:GDSL-type esterase/lipase family protein n=1 Tax=Uliginosibacterium silvisoli TaxID=3114758 RepID=A0ABU6KBE1_9RHOO|nr:GDSL-type esterase/lipase family protein [Uliginosibacterium sp. H3]
MGAVNWRGVVAGVGAAACVIGCSTPGVSAGTRLSGVVSVGGPLSHAVVTVADANGVKRSTTADAQGSYVLDAAGLTAPLLLSAVEPGNANCDDSAKPWAKCFGALVAQLGPEGTTANINALTDRVVSGVAQGLKFKGPQGLIDSGRSSGVTAESIRVQTAALRPAILQALKDAGVVDAEQFDPVSTPMKADRTGVDAVLDVLVPSRGYDNNSGVPGGTALLDADYYFVGKLDAQSPLELLNFARARAAKTQLIDPAYTRILIVGDSTASTYELGRLPRMGWGQVFEALFKPGAKVKVVNNAKSGRSSRAFYNQGYYEQMAAYLRPGDYVMIHHGHNDQSCDATKKDRGAADVANLCSYPNDASGKPQYPAGRPDMSFQKSLERFITLARAKGAIPVLMTPTSRVWNKDRKDGLFPVVPNHFTTQNDTQGFAFIGDYIQTIKDTASANTVPLIDIEAKTISFANAHQADWKDYWLAVKPAEYSWYATQTSGTWDKPDTTHFQEKGARAVAEMVAQGIRETPELSRLAAMLKNPQ